MKDLDLILKNIKNKVLQPIYFLHGEESFYIDLVVKSLETEVLSEDEKAFNQTVIYGKDSNYAEVLAMARQYPMMGDKILIIVKEAQDLKLTAEDAKILLAYAENPVPSTILVFAHKNKNLDGKFRKLNEVLKSNKYLFQSDKIRDYEVPKFIQQQIEKFKLKASPNISFLLSEYLGTDLSRIYNELQKLKLILDEGEILNEKIVEKHIGISKEYNVFELQKAIGQRDCNKAMKIVFYMGKNPKSNPLGGVTSRLYEFFSGILIYHVMPGAPQAEIAKELKVHPFFVKDYAEASRFYPLKMVTRVISIIREFDMKYKGLGANQTEDADLLKEMVYKILNVHLLKVKT